MSRYIDADLIEYHDSFTNDGEFWSVAFKDDIDNIPTADVVEVTSGKYDCVSREKVRDLLHEYMNNDDFTIGYLDDCYCEMPSLDVRENVKSEWIGTSGWEECSVCHWVNTTHLVYHFCPNCGARMVEE